MELIGADGVPAALLGHHRAGRCLDLFVRDVDNVCGCFRRHGIEVDALDVAVGLWARHVM